MSDLFFEAFEDPDGGREVVDTAGSLQGRAKTSERGPGPDTERTWPTLRAASTVGTAGTKSYENELFKPRWSCTGRTMSSRGSTRQLKLR